MSAFGDYAEWYDLFYVDKDYGAEAAFVDETLRQHGAESGTLLEIGCGTGSHAVHLAARGWKIFGIDQSAGMLERARKRFEASGDARLADVELQQGDARSFDLGRQFDVVVSLFHVMSYQADPGAIEGALASARRHSCKGGLFLFDFWFGPAVLAEKPEKRERTVKSDRFRVVRRATPGLDEEAKTVDVRYHFDVEDLSTGQRHEVDELHRMRFLFPDELKRMGEAAGFSLEALEEWMTHRAPNERTWNAHAVLRAV